MLTSDVGVLVRRRLPFGQLPAANASATCRCTGSPLSGRHVASCHLAVGNARRPPARATCRGVLLRSAALASPVLLSCRPRHLDKRLGPWSRWASRSWRLPSCCSRLVGSPQCFALPSAGYSPGLASSHMSSHTHRVTLDQPPTFMTEHAAHVSRPSHCIARRASIAPALSSPPPSDAHACSSDLLAVSVQPKLNQAPQRSRGNARW